MSRDKQKIQVISVPQCQSVAFEVIQSLGTFRKAKPLYTFLTLLRSYSIPLARKQKRKELK